jgi:hypothetical protein
MKKISYWGVAACMATAVAAQAVTTPTYAQDTSQEQMLERLIALEAEMQLLKEQLIAAKAETAQTKKIAKKAVKTAGRAKKTAVKAVAAADKIRPNAWHMTGYADVGVEISNGDNPGTFTAGKFNPAFHFQYKDLLIFESELEIQTSASGETEMEVEYSQLDFLLHDNATLVVGKFLSPVGQFQERLHPSWINRMTNPPAGFAHGGIQPIGEVGFMLRGGKVMGDRLFTYSLAMGNGPRAAHDAVEVEGFGRDDNKNKALSGRLAFFPMDQLEIGGSFLTAKVKPASEPAGAVGHDEGGANDELELNELSQGKYNLWGADFAYTKGNWDVRGEYLNAKLEGLGSEDDVLGDSFSALTWEAWYAQAAYRMSGVTDSDFVDRLEPVVRYGQYSSKGDLELREAVSEKRFNIGMNYWLSSSVVVKSALEFRNYLAATREDDTRFQLQLSYGF